MDMGTLIAVDTKTTGEGCKVLVASPARSGVGFLFLGCSLPSTGEVGKTKEGALSFNLPSLEKDSDQHVLAVAVRCSGNFHPVLMPMDRSGLKLDKAFVPDPDRLADIIAIGGGDYALRVFYRPDSDAQAQIFTTQKGVPGTFYVADGNLLCRLLVGKAEIAELRAVAEEFVAELSVREQLDQIRRVLQEDMGGDDPGSDLAECVRARFEFYCRDGNQAYAQRLKLEQEVGLLKVKVARYVRAFGDIAIALCNPQISWGNILTLHKTLWASFYARWCLRFNVGSVIDSLRREGEI